MLGVVLVLTQVAAAAAAGPAPSAPPVVLGAPATAASGSLSDRAGLIKLKTGSASSGGSFSAVRTTVPESSGTKTPLPGGSDSAPSAAQDRMNRAVRDGKWTNENIHHNTRIQDAARSEWDDAAENCRKSPGCKPVFRDDGTGSKPLKTGAEKIDDMTRGTGLSKDGLRKY